MAREFDPLFNTELDYISSAALEVVAATAPTDLHDEKLRVHLYSHTIRLLLGASVKLAGGSKFVTFEHLERLLREQWASQGVRGENSKGGTA